MNNKYLVIALLCSAVGVSSAAVSEAVSIRPQTNVLQRIELAGTPYQVGMGITEFAPNATKARQVQTGPEVLYVLQGEIVYIGEGQPARIIKAGESYQIPAGEVHLSKAGPQGAKILATWVLKIGKPFAVPVP